MISQCLAAAEQFPFKGMALSENKERKITHNGGICGNKIYLIHRVFCCMKRESFSLSLTTTAAAARYKQFSGVCSHPAGCNRKFFRWLFQNSKLNFAAIRDEKFQKVHKTAKTVNKSAYFSS
jgi:hypothetical protein